MIDLAILPFQVEQMQSAEIDLESIEFNTPPNNANGSAILPNEMSSIVVEPDQTVSVFDQPIPSATRTRDSNNIKTNNSEKLLV